MAEIIIIVEWNGARVDLPSRSRAILRGHALPSVDDGTAITAARLQRRPAPAIRNPGAGEEYRRRVRDRS